jgi:hypothetical protein
MLPEIIGALARIKAACAHVKLVGIWASLWMWGAQFARQ